MIRQINDEKRLYELLDGKADIFSEKIRAFYRAYGTGYPFCRFYEANGFVIGSYYGSGVIYPENNAEKDEELELFLRYGQFNELFMAENVGDLLFPDDKKYIDNIMCLKCNQSVYCLSDINKEDFSVNSSIGQIYEIVKDGFDIDFDTWYTDTSHNVRHGISEIYSYKGLSCALNMFSSKGISYLSYVCTKENERGKGYASRVISFAARRQAEQSADIYIVCEDRLKSFYQKNNFLPAGKAVTVKLREKRDQSNELLF